MHDIKYAIVGHLTCLRSLWILCIIIIIIIIIIIKTLLEVDKRNWTTKSDKSNKT